jgi:hypothetical protein
MVGQAREGTYAESLAVDVAPVTPMPVAGFCG